MWQILAKLENVDYTRVLILTKVTRTTTKKTSTVSFSNHENRVQYKNRNGLVVALDNNNT